MDKEGDGRGPTLLPPRAPSLPGVHRRRRSAIAAAPEFTIAATVFPHAQLERERVLRRARGGKLLFPYWLGLGFQIWGFFDFGRFLSI